jgi:hypothetical protein
MYGVIDALDVRVEVSMGGDRGVFGTLGKDTMIIEQAEEALMKVISYFRQHDRREVGDSKESKFNL